MNDYRELGYLSEEEFLEDYHLSTTVENELFSWGLPGVIVGGKE